MKIIIPATITSGMVTANTAVDAHATYNAGTTYALNAMVTYNLRYYKSLQAANTGHTPGDVASVAWWSDQGPSNKWAMFDPAVNTQTTASDTLSFTVTPITASAIGLVNITAAEVVVAAVYDGDTIYTRTVSMWDTGVVGDWGDYFFAEPEYAADLSLTDLPVVPGLAITVTLNRTGGTVGVGAVVMGKPLDAGLEQYGLKREGTDYSKVVFDEYGAVSITKRAYAKKFSTQVLVPNRRLNVLTKRLDQIASTPVLVIGANCIYNSLIVYGLVSYSLDLALYQYSYISFEVKGLT